MAGAGGKALLCQLSNEEIDRILSDNPLKPIIRKTYNDRHQFTKQVFNVRKDGVAADNEEYIDGIVACAVPLKLHQPGVQATIWAVGLEQQVSRTDVLDITELLKKVVAEINLRFSRTELAATILEN